MLELIYKICEILNNGTNKKIRDKPEKGDFVRENTENSLLIKKTKQNK